MMRHLVAIVVIAFALSPIGRPLLEASMLRHMVLGVPLLIGAGVLLGWPPIAARRATPWWNAGGVPGLVVALGMLAAVMVPRVLDLAVQSWSADLLKAIVAVLGGAAIARAWHPLGAMGQAFAVGNTGWMLGAAGLLLQQWPDRVCSVYLQGDQRRAGVGLVVAAVVVIAAWLATVPWRDEVPVVEATEAAV